jgi:DNA damage-inducible protein 1
MSRKCAGHCGIMRLVDPRFAGVAVGVGEAKIVGSVHLAPIVIGKRSYNCSFTVLDGEAGNMDLLRGLDMLRKTKTMIDLRSDCLHVGGDKPPLLGEAQRCRRSSSLKRARLSEQGSRSSGKQARE